MVIFNIITIIISAFALLVSFFAWKQSKKQHRQNIKIKKIERIMIIIEDLTRLYPSLIQLCENLRFYYNETSANMAVKKNYFEEYKTEREQLLKELNINEITGFIRELEIIARLYLRKELQFQVLSLNRLFRDLISYSVYMNRIIIEMFWKEGVPNLERLNSYVDELQYKLIDEIGFEKNIDDFRKTLRKYSNDIFKKEIEALNGSIEL